MRVVLLLGVGGGVGFLLGMLVTLLVSRMRARQRAIGRAEGARAHLRDVPADALLEELSRRGPLP